eukprot:gnl/TRDRNA2_/TRDRNA2_180566_c0_seq1.p1 gnl/TRDRNA2_/TRDRNA2_180566_c0~~gnl/TRDRNA2_/TRDRNA2_180566_c0_seq1.p1  ORF type:complete len:339 (+),score=77.93 gnl/TRDRNA2_/TRDRNA2_180566_c0_seq1:68-1084(+)
MFKIGAETHNLLNKKARQVLQPLQILVTVLVPSAAFAWIYYCISFHWRYETIAARGPSLGWILGPILFFVLNIVLTILTVNKWRQAGSAVFHAVIMDEYLDMDRRWGRSIRFWLCLTLCMWGALIAGTLLGERNYWKYSANYLTYKDMAVYVNIDPAQDKGQAFMDAGQVYFKESSYVDRSMAIAFKNGNNFCAAPIVRGPLKNQDGSSGGEQTVSGFVVPPSGTIDFWAVGTDCCGDSGNDFTCTDVESALARSGNRLLDDNTRPMYLLAVQEWSASTGLPVRHPLFFSWVKDPLLSVKNLHKEAFGHFEGLFFLFLLFNIVGAFVLNVIFQKLRIY